MPVHKNVCEIYAQTSLLDASCAPPTCPSTKVALGHESFIAFAKGFLQKQTSCQLFAEWFSTCSYMIHPRSLTQW